MCSEKFYGVDQRVRVDEVVDAAEYEKEPNVLMAEVEWAIGQQKITRPRAQMGYPLN